MDEESLAHTKWNCKYHIVFAPKHRRQVIYGKIKADTGRIRKELCGSKGIVTIPPKIAATSFKGYLKGSGNTMLYEHFGELKYKHRSREFWCTGYYVFTVGKNKR